jgi:hypothetical protein
MSLRALSRDLIELVHEPVDGQRITRVVSLGDDLRTSC